jgi:hypothetical protein
MSKDDIEVIEYKILKYLYESIKSGHKTTFGEAFKITLGGVVGRL